MRWVSEINLLQLAGLRSMVLSACQAKINQTIDFAGYLRV
jgi:hypothetical protein